ncbi:hypothetical protein EVAR_94843_1 [Eumeta japonica]|uniref:Uncharacterized protein n=1 Tax=Eumeta variegata TaxID=151549 RepID=A0A4C1UH65_EUMVA|nr:hypothetical protein EVAR_94843_1 [Eumeta japonica]
MSRKNIIQRSPRGVSEGRPPPAPPARRPAGAPGPCIINEYSCVFRTNNFSDLLAERDWHFTEFRGSRGPTENSDNQLYLPDWIGKLDCISSDFNNSIFYVDFPNYIRAFVQCTRPTPSTELTTTRRSRIHRQFLFAKHVFLTNWTEKISSSVL